MTVYLIMNNPAYWRRRLAVMFGTAGLTMLAMPTISIYLSLPWAAGSLESAPSLAPYMLLFLSFAFAILETLAERKNGSSSTTTPAAPSLNLERYLSLLIRDVSTVRLPGLAWSSVDKNTPQYVPIEKLYTPLFCISDDVRWSGQTDLLDHRELKGFKDLRRHLAERTVLDPYWWGDDRIALSELIQDTKRIVLIGRSGSGKTTFVKLVACALARDCIENVLPKASSWRKKLLQSVARLFSKLITRVRASVRVGKETPISAEPSSWREKILGFRPGTPVLIPAFIRIANLADHVSHTSGDSIPRDRSTILQILAKQSLDTLERERDGDILASHRQAWDNILKKGKALLLLDGLDEIDDIEHRERILEVIQDACECWPEVQVIVTSRPLQSAFLQERMDFRAASIDDFGPRDIEHFVQKWEDLVSKEGRSSDLARTLLKTIDSRQEVGVLARNPVSLTFLCVVHWGVGRLPEGRAQVYRAVFGWMLDVREKVRSLQLEDRSLCWEYAMSLRDGLGFLAIMLAMSCRPDQTLSNTDSQVSETQGSSDGWTTTNVLTTTGSSSNSGGLSETGSSTGEELSCSTWTQDCPAGMKCMPHGQGDAGGWDATSCKPVVDMPADAGEPCMAFESEWSGLDTCAAGSICWYLSGDNLEGVCVDLCTGSFEMPDCKSPHTYCKNAGELYLCMPKCSPVIQDCGADNVCDADPNDAGGFECLPDTSGIQGKVFDNCSGPGTCDPFLTCRQPLAASGCDPNNEGCCLPYCWGEGDPVCADLGLTCVPYYADPKSEAPPALWALGVCEG